MSEFVMCPICRKIWEHKGQCVLRGGKTYDPKPTRRGFCTCPECEVEPVPPHLPPNGAGTFLDPSPWQENAIRALEDEDWKRCGI